MNDVGGSLQGWSATLSTAVGAASSAVMAFNILGSIMDTISNPDLTGWERFTAILGSVVMLIPAIVNAWSGFAAVATAVKTAISTGTMATTLNTIAKMINAAATRE
ncbi:MAG: hypothetical protein IKB70_08550 [Bacilli bacterium]|nr:hypothetical protein [Bacilli bacterium]